MKLTYAKWIRLQNLVIFRSVKKRKSLLKTLLKISVSAKCNYLIIFTEIRYRFCFNRYTWTTRNRKMVATLWDASPCNIHYTKMKFSITDFFSEQDQIRIWSQLRKRSLMETFIFCAAIILPCWCLFYSIFCWVVSKLPNKLELNRKLVSNNSKIRKLAASKT